MMNQAITNENSISKSELRDLIISQPFGQTLMSKGFDTKTSFSDAGLDSMDLVTAIVDLEEEFDIDIPLESIQQLKNVDDVIQLIHSLKNQ